MMVLAVKMVWMMFPMKPVAMTMVMATISTLQEGISLADFSLPESFSLFSVFRLVEAVEYFLRPLLCLRVSGG